MEWNIATDNNRDKNITKKIYHRRLKGSTMVESVKKYDAIVIGSGVGGLSAGLLLADAGKRTLLLEKNDLIGGRLTSYEKDGFKVDLGVHVISRTLKGPYGELLNRVGYESSVEYIKVRPLSSYDGKVFVFPHDLKEMVPAEDFTSLMAFMKSITDMSDEEVSSYNDIDIKTYLSRFTDNDMVHACISNIATIYACLPSWYLSAGEFMRCLRFEGAARASGYPVGGCAAVSNELADAFAQKGGELWRSAPVERIIVENNKVSGVVVNGETIEAPLVVSNADIQATVLKLVGKEHFNSEYVQYVKDLKYSWYGCIQRIALDTVLSDIKMLTQFGSLDQPGYYEKLYRGEMPEELNLFIVSPSNFSPEVAPEGKQLINFSSPIPIDLPQSILEDLKDAMMDTAEKYVPGLRDHILWEEYTTRVELNRLVGEHGVGIGVGQYPDQVCDKRPSNKTSIEGLYIVGGEAGGTGVGIELCINSALDCFDKYLA